MDTINEYKSQINKLEENDIKDEYERVMVPKGCPSLVSLYGYISTSRNRQHAESFAFSNKDCGEPIFATLFIINWTKEQSYYYMDMSPYKVEDEILLTDGERFRVISVNEETGIEDKKLFVITLDNKVETKYF